jgi:hypothetical protein
MMRPYYSPTDTTARVKREIAWSAPPGRWGRHVQARPGVEARGDSAVFFHTGGILCSDRG